MTKIVNEKLFVRFTTGNRRLRVLRELGVNESARHKWRKEAIATASDGKREVVELKRRQREVEMERDLLIKAALSFGRSG